MTSLQSRLLVAAIGTPLLLWVVLWAPMWVLAVMLAALSGVAAWELLHCVGVQEKGLFPMLTVMVATFVVLCYFDRTDWVPFLLLGYVLVAFAIAVGQGGNLRFAQLMAGLFAVSAIPWAFSAFLRIHGAGHRGYLLLPFLFSFASDTCAYFAGRALGKHKLAPKVSPNKTVEGSIGGLIGNAVAGGIFAYVMDVYCGETIDILGMMVLGLACSVIAQLGDLSFSLIKREHGIKDYGHIFLAHGGVLDRFDSVLFVAPTMALVLPYLLG